MAKGSAPPLDFDQHEQAMPASAAPPSYEQSQSTGGHGGGFVHPPPNQTYPNLAPEYQGHGHAAQPQPPPVVITQVHCVQAPSFGFRPVTMTCPNCQQNITTATDSRPSASAWVVRAVLCVVLCLVGLWPCACIPCCVGSMQKVSHKCPNCNHFLGRYRGGLGG